MYKLSHGHTYRVDSCMYFYSHHTAWPAVNAFTLTPRVATYTLLFTLLCLNKGNIVCHSTAISRAAVLES